MPFSSISRAVITAITAFFLSTCLVVAQSEPEASDTPQSTSASDLLDILKDDAARNELISQLEKAATEIEEPEAEGIGDPVVLSFGARVAELSKSTLEKAAASVSDAVSSIRDPRRILDDLRGDELQVLWNAVQELLFIILATIGVFIILRRFAVRLFRRYNDTLSDADLRTRVELFIFTNFLDALVVVAAWAIGYAIALFGLGAVGEIGLNQSLYLNAFLAVELAKVILRVVLSPNVNRLRLVEVTDWAARRCNRVLSYVVSITGYSQLLVVPIVARGVDAQAAGAISAILAAVALLVLVSAVLRYRRDVGVWLDEKLYPPQFEDADEEQLELLDHDLMQTENRQIVRREGWLSGLARRWHWIVLIYIGYMFIIVMTQSTEIALMTLWTSAKVLGIVLLGFAVAGAFSRRMEHGITLPEHVNETLPLLQPRINGFVPRVFMVLRFFILLCVGLFAADTIGLLDVGAWLESRLGVQITAALLSVGLILLVAFALWLAMTSWIDFRLSTSGTRMPSAREITLLSLLKNAATIALIILTLMFCLSELGLDIGPLIASAGVFGLALGFGAQKMVQDIITGVFIQFENSINVGDVITVAGTTGVVEKLTVRSVSLRDVHGVFHIIPFSSVDLVSNFTRDFSFFVCDMGVAYRENVAEVKEAMFDAFDKLRETTETPTEILDDLEWFGLNAFGDSAIVLRARVKTLPGSQWKIGREYNAILKEIFDDRGIEIPYPHQTLVFAEGKDGSTQPIKIERQADEQMEPSTA